LNKMTVFGFREEEKIIINNNLELPSCHYSTSEPKTSSFSSPAIRHPTFIITATCFEDTTTVQQNEPTTQAFTAQTILESQEN